MDKEVNKTYLKIEKIFTNNKHYIQRTFKVMKEHIILAEKFEKEIKTIHEQIDNLEWNEENRITRINIYQNLGRLYQTYRHERNLIYFYNIALLKNCNLTG